MCGATILEVFRRFPVDQVVIVDGHMVLVPAEKYFVKEVCSTMLWQ
jgi:hypothetical protein